MAEGDDSYARSLAQRALDEAREALGAAREAMNEVRALDRRVDSLEEVVRELIRVVERGLQELVQQTHQVREAVITQGQQIRSSVDTQGQKVQSTVETQGREILSGVNRTTESVSAGFTSMSHQEVKGRLLDSRTALIGLATKLVTAKNALLGEFDQARRRTEELKVRYTEAFERTVQALRRDVDRLGAKILRVQEGDFRDTVERFVPAARQRDVFALARDVGTASLASRNAALESRVEHAKVEGLDQFESNRQLFLEQLRTFMHKRLTVPEGDYAMRIYFAEGRMGRECVVGAQVAPQDGRVAFTKADTGLGRFSGSLAESWALPGASRPLSDEEKARVKKYVGLLAGQGLLTPQESGIILTHLDRSPLEVHIPSVESSNGTAA